MSETVTTVSTNSNWKPALVGGALLALLASNIYLFVQVYDMKAASAKSQDALTAQIQELKDNTTTIAATQRQHYQALSQDLDRRTRDVARAATSARTDALKSVALTKQELEAEQAQTAEKINGDLSSVKQATDQKFTEVNTDVGNVKQQVSTTQSDLQKTIATLSHVQGDLGVTSGLVAKNGTELEALKRLGERNYFEFNIKKTKQPQKVGDIQVLLRKTDPKKNKFTLTVMADDKTIEKKDKTADEPVQFYVAKARQPYEIVVNEVRKDQVVGYLATPKDTVAR
ncbi:hypothetical protein [Nevskia soli]|uniref:hypothetical protein n=1 Tax=Nevskia soli TaxID=418856 RepID=UPI0015D9453E|nr:hypothetical protein [Nevskia soli]